MKEYDDWTQSNNVIEFDAVRRLRELRQHREMAQMREFAGDARRYMIGDEPDWAAVAKAWEAMHDERRDNE